MHRAADGTWHYSPKDLIAWLEGDFAAWCEREAAERRSGAAGVGAREPDARDDEMELAVRYGLAHEQAHLERLRANHPDLIEVDSASATAAADTLEAMASGASVVFQGVLSAGAWMGIADFLHRTPHPSGLGGFSYEPWDTKLARSAKPYFLLQLSAYAELLAAVQGLRPERLGFILGDGREASYQSEDFRYYYQRLKAAFERFQRGWQPDAMPDPGADRTHGRWSDEAARLLAARDDLSLVAGIARSTVIRLREQGIVTVDELGRLDPSQSAPGISSGTLTRVREQAAVQLRSREQGRIAWEFRLADPDDPRRGLALLPPPSRLDVFYDIEGFPYARTGLEYLQGAVTREGDDLLFHDWWAHDDATERIAFEQFIDWVWERWQRDPAMHVYHYAGYERNALATLSTKHATREYELDEILRHDLLVDLLAVVRQGMVIGTPSYSLKDIEHLYMPARDGEVLSAGASVVEYQRWLDSGEPEEWRDSPILAAIRDYNRVDCESTAMLAEWLLARQTEAGIAWIRREDLPEVVTPREHSAQQELAESLLERSEGEAGEQRRVTELLAWLLEFHRRDAKPMWWRYFERLGKDEQELYDDPDCLAGLVRTEREPWPEDRSKVYEYAFDADQESRLHEGSKVHVVSHIRIKTTIRTLDPLKGVLTMKLGVKRELPARCHLIPDEHQSATPIAAAIECYVRPWAEGVVANRAVDDLLWRRPPRLRGHVGGSVIPGAHDLLTETTTVLRAMDGTTIAIQGPPGTGKTTTAAAVIAALLNDGKRIGIMANSHAVVNHLLAKLVEVAPRHRKLLHKFGGDEAPGGVTYQKESGKASELLGEAAIVLGGTAWLFAREEMRDRLDYLFIDEAGQVSLGNAVGAGLAARNLVLIGDQMQLAQPTQGVHPGESGRSCLEYLLADHQTVPPEMGILLDVSYRMQPDLCRFISTAYYEGRLTAHASTHDNRIEWAGPAAGVQFVPVEHEGRTQSSVEECDQIAVLLGRLIGSGVVICGESRALALDDVLIVAPFNAQVRALKQCLPAGARVGTVDKFQGQEAPVVIVSMCASTLDDAPRGAGFLLSPNRLNVAMSRAQALALVVGSPRLGDVRVRSVEEMKLVNGWCRVEGCGGV